MNKNKPTKPVMESDNPCEGCSLCCRYVALEIDKPTTKSDMDQIRWYLIHKNVWVFVDNDNTWNIQFNTPCEKLDKHLCSIYETRPQICRDYSTENCERYGEGDPFKLLFKTEEDLLKWLKEKKPKLMPKHVSDEWKS